MLSPGKAAQLTAPADLIAVGLGLLHEAYVNATQADLNMPGRRGWDRSNRCFRRRPPELDQALA
jgi:hypothetical protein